ncbi:MAG: YbdK family carboxylate-amine ligase [Gemmataceae bacterium]
MTPYPFEKNDWPTLGVEIELQLVDAQTMALRNAFPEIQAQLTEDQRVHIKPELMQSYLEINTNVCRRVADVEADLKSKIALVEQLAERVGVRLFWAGTHPFSPWSNQEITPNERYLGLVKMLADTARRLVTFGLHVHVGVNSGDKAVMVCDRLMRHLPTLLALSANSPFWGGRNTGLHSQRIKIIEGLPTAGLPPLMRNWSEYVWLVNQMIETGFIQTIREIWWDVRPHHNFGTVEVRICDIPTDLSSVLALTALIQCLVHELSEQIDQGTYQFDCHPMLVRLNKWLACRYGPKATLVDPFTHEREPLPLVARNLVRLLRHRADELGCTFYLEHILNMTEQPTGSERQLAIFEETDDLAEVVRRMVKEQSVLETTTVAS